MRITCLIDSLGQGGAERQLTALAVGLKRRGHEVDLLAYYPADHFRPELEASGVKYRLASGGGKWGTLLRLRKILRAGTQEVVLAFLEGPSLYAELAALPWRKWGLVVSERAPYPGLERGRAKWRRWPHHLADAVVANSHTCGLQLKRAWPELSDRIVTVYNAIDLDVFQADAKDARDERSSPALRIVVAARSSTNKNMLGVAKALKHLRDSGSPSRLTVDWFGGPGRNPEALAAAQGFVRENGLVEWLSFHGATSQIRSEFRSADAVALFSFREGLPNTVCEGMACGKPILMSDVCDSGSLVVDGENGFVGDPRSPQSMASAFRRFADLSPADRQEMGRASRRRAELLLASDTIVGRYERILEAAAARRPPPEDCNWPATVPESARRTVARWSDGQVEGAEAFTDGR